MKKLVLFALAGAMTLSLAACANNKAETTQESETASDKEREAEESAANETGEDTDAAHTEAVSGEETDGQEETDVLEAAVSAGAPDLSAAVDASATSETQPVPFGTWAKTTLYATQDGTFHTAYVRLAKVTTQSQDAAYVKSAIEANDIYGEAEDAFDASVFEVPEDGELVVLDYEVYVPEDFPAATYGMPEPRLYFSMRNIGGGGIPSTDGSETYVGLGTTRDLIVRDGEEVYRPGYTYTERCIYAMVDGYTKYVATYSTYPEGTNGEDADVSTLYTVYHAVR